MNLYRRLEGLLLCCIKRIWIIFIAIHEIKVIYQKRYLYRNVVLTKDQKAKIDDYYKKNYGRKIPYWWHRLYQSYTGNFDHRYIPDYIYAVKLEPKTNQRINTLRYEDKNMLSVLFGEKCRIPETYIMCINGKYFDGTRKPVSKQKAVEILTNMKDGWYSAIIKVSVDTGSGKGVKLLEIENGKNTIKNQTINDVLDGMGDNFVVQEKIQAHEAFSRLYPNSINTIRIVTYMVDESIHIAPALMRIGKGGSVVDNAHAGGIFIGISDDGRLSKEAFTEFQERYTSHPDTNIVFENYQLPCMSEIRKIAVELHKQIPMLRVVSYDFTVDSEGRPVLIEINLHSQSPWMSQMANGKAFFGDDTACMLQYARGKRSADIKNN